jgi:hypothetical protein
MIGFLASGIFGALVGYALASVGGYRHWIGIVVGGLVPVFGVMALAIASIASAPGRAPRPSADEWWVTSKAGLSTLLSVSALAGLQAISLRLGWFTVRFLGLPASTLSVWGSAVGFVIMVSILVLAFAALLGLRGPSRLAGTAVAAIGSIWPFLSGTAVALRAPLLQLAASIGAVKISPDDVLTFLGAAVDLDVSQRAGCGFRSKGFGDPELGTAAKPGQLVCVVWVHPVGARSGLVMRSRICCRINSLVLDGSAPSGPYLERSGGFRN